MTGAWADDLYALKADVVTVIPIRCQVSGSGREHCRFGGTTASRY
jgi:hypothetical protein